MSFDQCKNIFFFFISLKYCFKRSKLWKHRLLLLQKCAYGFHCVFREKHAAVCSSHVLNAFVDFFVLFSPEDVFQGIDSNWWLWSNWSGSFQKSFFHLLFCLKYFWHQTNTLGLLCVHPSACVTKLSESRLIADYVGENLQCSQICCHSNIHFLNCISWILSAISDISHANQVDSTSNTHVMNTHQYRHFALNDWQELPLHLMNDFQKFYWLSGHVCDKNKSTWVLQIEAEKTSELLKIEAGSKSLALSNENNRSNIFPILVQCCENELKLLEKGRIHSIDWFWPVDRNSRDLAIIDTVDFESFVWHFFAKGMM